MQKRFLHQRQSTTIVSVKAFGQNDLFGQTLFNPTRRRSRYGVMTLCWASETVVTPRLVASDAAPRRVAFSGRFSPDYRLISYRPENSITSPDAVRNFT